MNRLWLISRITVSNLRYLTSMSNVCTLALTIVTYLLHNDITKNKEK